MKNKLLVEALSPLRMLRLAPGPILWLLCVTASAEEIRIVEESVLVTGTRLEGSLTAMPGHLTVIDRELIESRQDQSVVDLLRNVAGVHVSQPGGRGSVSSVILRGAEPNFTAVYINGVRVNDPNNSRGGSFDFSTINLAEVARIEIARGAHSAVYGSDSLAGVINIITRDTTDELSGSVDAEIGQDDYWRLGATASGAMGDVTQWSLSATAVDDGSAIEGNRFDGQTLDARLATQPLKALDLDFSLRLADSESESFPEDSGGPELAIIRDVDRRDQEQLSFSGLLKYALSERWALRGQIGYLDHQEDFNSPGVADGVRAGVPPNSSDSDLERTNASLYTLFTANESISTTAGLSWERERGDVAGEVEFAPGFALPTDYQLDRDIVGAFAEFQLNAASGFSLAAAIRYDDPSTESGQTTGRISAQYSFADTRVFGNWSQGFKLPSFFALGHALVGNPDLVPETSESWELGVSQRLLNDRLDLTLTAFTSRYEDLIDFDFDLFTNVNRDQVDTDGFELEANYQPLEVLALTAHVTYVDIDVQDNATTLRQRPDWRGGVSGFWSITSKFKLTCSWLYVGDVFDSSIPTGGQTLDAYSRVDAKLAWQPVDRLDLWLAADNLLDESYQEAIGFPALGARARLGLRWRL